MTREPRLFDVDARLRELSAKGDDLERVNALVDFEAFRPELEQAVPRADRSKGGRPPYDHVLMFRILILQASHSLSDERTEYLVKDRLSFMRFLGLSLADRVPDANSIWTFREALTRAQIGGVSAIEALFRRFDAMLSAAGYIAMGGQIVDATVVAAPKQRNTEDEKRALKEGRHVEASDAVMVSPTYVPDLVHATLDLLVDRAAGVWHLDNQGMISWHELAARAASEAGIDASRLVRVDGGSRSATALSSERGLLLPTLEGAIQRYVRDTAAYE